MNNLPDSKNKNILITGGSGFLGRALIPQLVGLEPASILAVGRDEGKLLEVQRLFDIDIMSGDISDRGFVERIMKQKDQVYHLAGFKHLPMAERQTLECVNTNIRGSQNILDASLYTQPEFVIATSTDKAWNPKNAYGMSKRLMEYLFSQYEQQRGGSRTKYRVVRYGNVFGSTGSVIPVWREALARHESIKITDPNMTRFFFPVIDAVQTLFDCLATSTDATPFVPTMKAAVMADLAKAFVGDDPYEVIGLRPGEKLDEEMGDGISSATAPKYSVEELKQMIATL